MPENGNRRASEAAGGQEVAGAGQIIRRSRIADRRGAPPLARPAQNFRSRARLLGAQHPWRLAEPVNDFDALSSTSRLGSVTAASGLWAARELAGTEVFSLRRRTAVRGLPSFWFEGTIRKSRHQQGPPHASNPR